jgi:N-formylglutamate amidohydrolase
LPHHLGVTSEAPPFAILPPGAPWRPIVAHVPHASTVIPPAVRAGILLDDEDLARELVRLTDHGSDRLFAWLGGVGATRLVNGRSRLVVDPERFPDDADEPMASAGQGAVYTRTADGRPLRALDDAARAALIAGVFVPYHDALTSLVAEALDRAGECLVIDCHSFATEPLPSEADQSPGRPDVCIGTDVFHTPPGLVAGLRESLAAEGFRVAVDRPFAGSIVPGTWYRRDARVRSVMLEVRRGLYCDEATGAPTAAFDGVAARLERAVRATIG